MYSAYHVPLTANAVFVFVFAGAWFKLSAFDCVVQADTKHEPKEGREHKRDLSSSFFSFFVMMSGDRSSYWYFLIVIFLRV